MASDPTQHMKEHLQMTDGPSDQGLPSMRDQLTAFETASQNMMVEKNLMVPMRDGVCLATNIYRPATGGLFPVLLVSKQLAITTGKRQVESL